MSVEINIIPENGAKICFKLPSQKEENLKQRSPSNTYPRWVELHRNKCNTCTLQVNDTPYCPAALKILEIGEQFPELSSCEQVTFQIKKEGYSFAEKISVQDALVQLFFNSIGVCACPEIHPETWSAEFFHPRSNLKGVLFRKLVMKLLAFHIGENKGRSLSKYLDKQTSVGLILDELTLRLESGLAEEESKRDQTLIVLYGILRTIKEGYEDFILDEIENNFIERK